MRRVHFASTLQQELQYNPKMLIADLSDRGSGSRDVRSGRNYIRGSRRSRAVGEKTANTPTKFKTTRAARRLALRHVARTDIRFGSSSSSNPASSSSAWSRECAPARSSLPAVLNDALELELELEHGTTQSQRSRHCTIC